MELILGKYSVLSVSSFCWFKFVSSFCCLEEVLVEGHEMAMVGVIELSLAVVPRHQ